MTIMVPLCKCHAQYFRHFYVFFFFNDTATTEIYTLSLHDALPICLLYTAGSPGALNRNGRWLERVLTPFQAQRSTRPRSEEHTSELQSPCNLVCRLLLEKKKKTINPTHTSFAITLEYYTASVTARN